MDTYQSAPDITFYRLSRTDAQMASYGVFVRDQIESELKSVGFNSTRKILAVYYGGAAPTCGGGPWPPALVGAVAAIYVNGATPGFAPCNSDPFTTSPDVPRYREYSMIHEIFHAMGAVPSCAPNHVLSGHASDSPTDLMYAGSLPWNPSILDLNRDDYYAHGRPCLDARKSVFLTPTTTDATPPPGWSALIAGDAIKTSGDERSLTMLRTGRFAYLTGDSHINDRHSRN